MMSVEDHYKQCSGSTHSHSCLKKNLQLDEHGRGRAPPTLFLQPKSKAREHLKLRLF